MPSRKKAKTMSVSSGQLQQANEKMVDNDKNERLQAGSARKGTRSASTAFGDHSDQSVESPVRKKQNTKTSIADKFASGNNTKDARTSINHVEIINGAVDVTNDVLPRCSVEEEKEDMLDIVPPTGIALEKPVAVATTSNIKDAEKMMRAGNRIQGPQNANCDTGNIETQTDDDSNFDHYFNKNSESQNINARNWSVGLGWVGIFIFANLFVSLGVIWSSLLLNERATYQLESLECRERLKQVYQAMDPNLDFEGMDENDGDKTENANDENVFSDRFEENQFYWQELEAQVRYWKKEAKKYQRYSDGYKEQCQKDLQHLLSELS